MVQWLDDHLARLANIVTRICAAISAPRPGGRRRRTGLRPVELCGATLRPGFETLAEILQLEKRSPRATSSLPAKGASMPRRWRARVRRAWPRWPANTANR